MRKISAKFLLSILSVFFAFVAIGSTTFAWFALSRTAAISSIEATIKSGDGIEFRLKKDSYRPTDTWSSGFLNLQEDDEFQTKTQNVKFAPVTYVNDTFKQIKIVGKELEYVDALPNKEYIQFSLQFRAKKGALLQSNTIKVSDKSKLDSLVKVWNPDIEFKLHEGDLSNVTSEDSIKVSASNSARVMIKNTSLNEETNLPHNTYTIWESSVNPLSGNTEGLNSKTDTYGALDYFKKKTDIGQFLEEHEFETPNYETSIFGQSEDVASNLMTGTDNPLYPQEYLTNSAYFYGEIEITIWLEGWDKECINTAIGEEIKIFLSFDYS